MKKCNMCGKDFDFWDEQNNFGFRKLIHYGSRHDGELLTLDLCCGCFDKVIDNVIKDCVSTPTKEAPLW